MKSFLMVLLVFTVTSCDKGRSLITSTAKANEKEALEAAGVKLHYFSNGKIRAKIPMDNDDKRHGVSQMFYPSGELKSEVTYDHGVRQQAKQYYKNGKLEMAFQYKEGMKQGVRKKYWDSGQLQSELEYHRNEAGMGLVEYNRKGKQLTQYPTLKVREIDNISTTGEYIVEVFFSEKPSRGTYYRGELIDGQFKHKGLLEIEKVGGKGRMVFKPAPGTFMMEKMHFVGSYKTLYGNPYLQSVSVNVAFEN
ncbi:MAG: hypothetical protein AAGA85_00675 [Bacteroidota bacterium]